MKMLGFMFYKHKRISDLVMLNISITLCLLSERSDVSLCNIGRRKQSQEGMVPIII